MAPLGPFESAPHLAVGLSGGADSLALVLLAARWARARGGTATALTVDHGLRPEAALEAAHVGRWMAGRGIAHVVLRGVARLPSRNIQAEARSLRHALLRGWCRDQGCLHLLLAHNLEDQAETLLLRLARGSGAGGLAGMAAVAWTPEVRILRPLLGVPRAALEAFLKDQGQGWVCDPSNDDSAYGRVRMRRLLPALAAEGADAPRLADTARRLGATRQVLDDAVGALMATAVAPHPAGFAWIDSVAFRGAPQEIGLRGLRTVVAAVGGRPFGPRADRAAAALGVLGDTAATLGGCRLLPEGDGRVLVAREGRGQPVVDMGPGDELLWDGRFRVHLMEGAGPGTVAALGTAGWSQVRARLNRPDVPLAARLAVPALWRSGRVVAVPALDTPTQTAEFRAFWSPGQVLLSGAFRLASAPSSII